MKAAERLASLDYGEGDPPSYAAENPPEDWRLPYPGDRASDDDHTIALYWPADPPQPYWGVRLRTPALALDGGIWWHPPGEGLRYSSERMKHTLG